MLIFVHKMLVYIIKFVWSGAVLVQEMGRVWFYRFLQWFISGGCHVYVLVADTALKVLLLFSNSLKKIKMDRNVEVMTNCV